MGDKSKIEWTDATWNVVTGCTKVSAGCRNCYAERLFPRVYGRDVVDDVSVHVGTPFRGDEDGRSRVIEMHMKRPRKFTDVKCHEDRLDQPLKWKRPRMVFVNSMSDLFHEDVPDSFIDRVFAVMASAPQHTFQILTKRPERMARYVNTEFRSNLIMDQMMALTPDRGVWSWPGWREAFAHLWLGVSVEDQATANERIPLLLQTPAAVRWVSAEPLLGPVDFEAIDTVAGAFPFMQERGWNDKNTPLRVSALRDGKVSPAHLDWIVAGGESGPKARPMHPDWARSIRGQCKAAGVPFFFKQWGEWWPGESGRNYRAEVVDWSDGQPMVKCGKKVAGCELDGIEHKEYPEVNHG